MPALLFQASAGFLSTPAGVALIGILGGLVGTWFGSRARIDEAIAKARIDAEVEAERRADERAEKRDSEAEQRYRQAKLDEIDAIKDLRESLRQRVKDQDETIERLEQRIKRLEDEAIQHRDREEKHGLERLAWFRERDEMTTRHEREMEELRETLAEAHRDLEAAAERIAALERMIEMLKKRVGPIEWPTDPPAAESA